MPKGPRGERRPADTIGAAVMVGRIATGEVHDPKGTAPNRAKGGKKGGKARAESMTPKKRQEIAKKAAMTRWESNRSRGD